MIFLGAGNWGFWMMFGLGVVGPPTPLPRMVRPSLKINGCAPRLPPLISSRHVGRRRPATVAPKKNPQTQPSIQAKAQPWGNASTAEHNVTSGGQ